MRYQDLRKQTADRVETAFHNLENLVGGDFSPGYFNCGPVLDAETRGLSVADGVLRHALRPRTSGHGDVVRELVARVARALRPDEITNCCHNVCMAVLLMLDRLGYPAAILQGTVSATRADGKKFILTDVLGPQAPGHTPGHSWLVTPDFAVLDLVLAYQSDVPGYEAFRGSIPCPVVVHDSESSNPSRDWFLLPNGHRFSAEQFADATKYQHVCGWAEARLADDAVVRYIPKKPMLPDGHGLDDVKVLIGGLSPGQFFERELSELPPAKG